MLIIQLTKGVLMNNNAEAISSEELAAIAKPKVETAVEYREPPRWLPSTFHSLMYRDYFLLWLGQISRSVSIWMDYMARTLLIITLTGSAVQLGLISLVRGLPLIFLSPIAGVLVDRFDRHLAMMASKGLAVVVNSGFAFLVLAGRVEVWHVFVTAFLNSLSQSCDNPARQALLPSLVPNKLLMNAIALNSGSMQAIRIISSSVAGFLIAYWAKYFGYAEQDPRIYGGVYLVVAISGALSLLATAFLKVPVESRQEKKTESWVKGLFDGFVFAFKHPIVLSLLTLFAIQSIFGLPYVQVFVPWLCTKVMGIGPEGTGLLVGMSGVGSLAGAIVVASLGQKIKKRGIVLICGLGLYGLALVGLGFSSLLPLITVRNQLIPLVPAIMIILVGIGQSSVITLKSALLVEATPDEFRGRMYSLQSLDRGLSMVGSMTAGLVINVVGGPIGQAMFGIVCTLGAGMVAWLSPRLRQTD
jgi:MFS family permease